MPLRAISRICGRALLALALAAPSTVLADPWLDLALNDAGEITIPPRTLAPNDYVMAVYAERLEDLPVSPAAVPLAPGALPEGCLPLVRIHTASGARRLPREAELAFGCADAPANARIHAWIDGRWQALPTGRLADGRPHARFTRATVYGVFLVRVPQI